MECFSYWVLWRGREECFGTDWEKAVRYSWTVRGVLVQIDDCEKVVRRWMAPTLDQHHTD